MNDKPDVPVNFQNVYLFKGEHFVRTLLPNSFPPVTVGEEVVVFDGWRRRPGWIHFVYKHRNMARRVIVKLDIEETN